MHNLLYMILPLLLAHRVEGLSTIGAAPITVLDLHNNSIGSEGGKAIAEALQANNVLRS